MRGRCREPEQRRKISGNFSLVPTLRLAERPPHPPCYRASTSPRTLGEVKNAPSFSPRPFAPELCRRPSKRTKAGRDLRQTAPVVGQAPSRSRAVARVERNAKPGESLAILKRRPGFHSVQSGLPIRPTKEKQESGTPTNAVHQPPRLAARHRPRRGGSPVGVPPRHLRQRPNATAQLQPRDFRGLGRRARPDGSKDARVATLLARTVRTAHVTAGVTRAFLSPSSEFAPADRS
jgi:hypothetical protein